MTTLPQGNDPVTWGVGLASSTSWFWLPSLAQVNSALTTILTVMGIGLTGYKIYIEWKKSNEQDR